MPPDIQAAAEALVKLEEDTLHNNIPYKDFMDTDDAIILGIKLAYHVLGRRMFLGDFA